MHRAGVGDFDTENIPGGGFNVLIYSIWLLSTFLILIVLLNMLIAIIIDIFEEVHESMNSNLLKELVVLMMESELLISRKTLFKKYRYIFVINKETGYTGRGPDNNKLSILKHHMDLQAANQNEVVDKIQTNVERYFECKVREKTDHLEHSTTKKIASISDQLEEHNAKLKEYLSVFEVLKEKL